MARHIPKRDGTAQLESPALAGGAGGAPPEAPRGPSQVASLTPMPKAPFQDRAEVPPQRYRVAGGPRRTPNGGVAVMYEGCRVELPVGKELTALQYDLELLRKQGVLLEPVAEDPPPEPEVGLETEQQPAVA